jgi:hypothetical protein
MNRLKRVGGPRRQRISETLGHSPNDALYLRFVLGPASLNANALAMYPENLVTLR